LVSLDRRFEAGFGRLAERLLAHRWLVLVVVGVLTAILGASATRLEVNTSNEYFFLHGDPFIERYSEFKDTFGSDEFVYVLVSTDDVFTAEALTSIRALSEALGEAPYVGKVTSLLNAEHLVNEDDSIFVRPFIGEDIPTDPKVLQTLRADALANPLYTDTFVSRDAKHAGIFIQTEIVEGDGDFRKALSDAMYTIVDRPEFVALQPRLVGPPILDAVVDQTIQQEFNFFGAISGVIILVILVWTFRRFIDVLSPMVIIGLTNVWLIGTMAFVGVPLTMMSFVLPALVMVVGCGDAIHIIAEYRVQVMESGEVKSAVYQTIRRTGLPCLFTSLTTAVGFGSLMAMEIRPGKEMGMFAALAVLIAFALSVTLLPVLLSFGSTPNIAKADNGTFARASRALLAWIADVTARRPWPIALVSIVIFVGALHGLTKVEVAADFLRVFSTDTRVRQDYEAVDATLGGTVGLELIVDGGDPSAIFEPDYLGELAALDQWLDDYEITQSTVSVLDVFEELVTLTSTASPRGTLPDSADSAAQLFLLYEMGGAEEIDRLVTGERDRAHLTARVRSVPTSRLKSFMEELDAWSAENLKVVSVSATGLIPLFVRMVETITKSQLYSFSLAFVAVMFMMMLQFRSVGLGLLAMIPNIFPIAFTLGFMGYQGITLNVGTVMIASIAIGIAVDDSIHFVTHYRHYLDDGFSTVDAVRAATTGVGHALLTTSVVLAVGFSVFGLSSMSHMVNFGLLTAMTVTTALVADFFLLPAILILLDRRSA